MDEEVETENSEVFIRRQKITQGRRVYEEGRKK